MTAINYYECEQNENGHRFILRGSPVLRGRKLFYTEKCKYCGIERECHSDSSGKTVMKTANGDLWG